MSYQNLVISGSIATDKLLSFSGSLKDMIDEDNIDVLSISILMDRQEIVYGGVAANLANNAAQLDLNPILLGAVGEDNRDYIHRLEKLGIDTRYVHYSSLPTANFTVFTDQDNNQIGGFYPGAMADSDSLSLEPWKGTKTVVCVSAQDADAMRRQVEECKKYDLTLIYDPGQQTNNISGEDLKAGCKAASVVVINKYELAILKSKTGLSDDNLRQGSDLFIVTMGEKGSTIDGRDVEEPLHIKACAPSRVKDPTGAGDGFRAGFFYGFMRQWDVKSTFELASVVGSFVVEDDGPQQTLSKANITERYKKEFKKDITLS